jgi:dTDP-4-amino-4,6-dideoxygalactose transaminase
MKLAVNGGTPVRTALFPAYNNIGNEEKKAVCEVLDSGVLSRFLGCWHDDFYGGPQIQELEKEWAEYFGAKHAISVNSCTSGLYCAVGATGTEPGDEIIVSPYTMSASATAALVYNAIPVFADIEEGCFCLDPDSVRSRITSKTRAIIVVDIFGQPYDAGEINKIAKEHGLIVIEDTAQAPGALYKGKFAGTLGDIGVYSLNYHKHIHSGEGGIIVTDNDELADRMRLIRNHAEAVVADKGTKNLVNMIGFNYRMTEMEAAVARCQLRKLDGLLKQRQKNCAYLTEKISDIPAIKTPEIRDGAVHAFYVYPSRFIEEKAGVSREIFIDAVKAELAPCELRESEGVLIGSGYVKPIYLEPMYQNLMAYGSKGYPFTMAENKPDYSRGICPVTERMHFKELFAHDLMRPPMNEKDLDDVAEAFHKVWENRKELKDGARK